MKYFLACLCAALLCGTSQAATYQMNTGVSIASGIASMPTRVKGDVLLVPAGTYTGGVSLSSPITLQAQGQVIVNATSPRSGTALNIACSDCAVIGFEFRDFGWAVSTGNPSPYARVTLKKSIFRRSGTVWINGDSWLLEDCEIDRPMVSGQPADVEDYMNVWGNGHTLRRCYFHGLNLSTDLPTGAHNDGIQFFTEGSLSWQRLTNLTIERCIFADWMQAVWLSNVANIPGALNGVTITDTVFWGEQFMFQGNSVWSPGGAMFWAATNVSITNCFFHKITSSLSLYNQAANSVLFQRNIIANNGSGNAYGIFQGSNSSSVNRGTDGNIIWQCETWSQLGAPDRNNVDPLIQNLSAVTGAQVVGPDGLPFTNDDAYFSNNLSLINYGVRKQSTTPANTQPTITVTGPASPIQLMQNSTSVGITLTATAQDAEGPVTLLWGNGATGTSIAVTQGAGSVTYTCTATDSGGLTATASFGVTVVPYSPPVNLPPTANAGPDQAVVYSGTPITITLSGTASDTDGTIQSVVWAGTPKPANTPVSSVILSATGVYTYIFTATDNGGASASDSMTITVSAPPPTQTLEQRIAALEAQVAALKAWQDRWPYRRSVRGAGTTGNKWVPAEN